MYELSKLQFILIVVQHISKSGKLLKKNLQIGRVMGKEGRATISFSLWLTVSLDFEGKQVKRNRRVLIIWLFLRSLKVNHEFLQITY